MGPTSYYAYYNYVLTNPQKGIWSFTIDDMINPQKGIDLMNNTSIIIRILFAVTLFQHGIICFGHKLLFLLLQPISALEYLDRGS
jgi:hypothetical protein